MVVRVLIVNIRITVLFNLISLSNPQCDDKPYSGHQEGNIGDVASFSWLGVLRAHFHEKGSFKIAITGIVMVRKNFAIANAEDVMKIPPHILKQDSKVMLLPNDRTPWYRKPADFVAHPEFEFSTYNTIGLLELAEDGNEAFPVKPICLPSYAYNTSDHLYAIGYTDGRYLKQIDEGIQEPIHYQCGFASNNKNHCTWENGMAIVSNASGKWNLIGFGLRGPGCSAPARFIDLSHYVPWIEATTNLNEDYAVYS